MRWSARPTRRSADFPPDREAVLRPLPGLASSLGGVELSGAAGLGGSGLGHSGHAKSALGHISTRSGAANPGKGSDALPNSANRADSNPENDYENAQTAQPLDEDGVPEDMATLVLDNSSLGLGSAARPDPAKPDFGPDAEAAVNAALDPKSDAAIMLRVAAGDESGFNFLVQKYHRAMIHFLFRMVRNQAVAEELAQDVFLRVYRSRESYRAEAKFTTWLYRIATNLAVNHARDTKHERSAQTIYLDAPDEETGTTPDVADDEPSVEQKLMRDERMAAIRTHVMALPERQRMAVLMHKYQGMDYRQIGDVLKLSESATKSLLFRAYQTLRDKLKDFV
jgi:RNA polymerase sigma-70 factor (ECF subfamily)